ncbi:MAG TPA: lyase family protein, partial [Phycisphaeraceae bacterium]
MKRLNEEVEGTRVETDLLGAVEVPAGALYGAQTQRALENFPLGMGKTIGSFPTLIEGLMLIKQAAARVNGANGFISAEQADAIIQAAREVRERKEAFFDQFPIHYLHGGGGTSANMNANEVLANLAEEILGGRRGQYRLVHPNDHVNRHQSTNDVYPTACHIAIILKWPSLRSALTRLNETLNEKAVAFQEHVRIARTCLQDAVAITFKDLLGGYGCFLERACRHLGRAVAELYAVNLGGTIVGRHCDVPAAYLEQIAPALAEAAGDPSYRRAENLFDAAQNPDPIVQVSAQLDILARGLIKIAKDFRLMASGPEAGLGEIRIPAVQPGSSIMPGKVNPVIPEFLIQAGFQAMGAHHACQAALDHGELDLNVWESTLVFNVLEAMDLLAAAI